MMVLLTPVYLNTSNAFDAGNRSHLMVISPCQSKYGPLWRVKKRGKCF